MDDSDNGKHFYCRRLAIEVSKPSYYYLADNGDGVGGVILETYNLTSLGGPINLKLLTDASSTSKTYNYGPQMWITLNGGKASLVFDKDKKQTAFSHMRLTAKPGFIVGKGTITVGTKRLELCNGNCDKSTPLFDKWW